MGQRLGIAAALLGDPQTLLFDEPINGLDPEGIVWVRSLLRSLAQEGRTVFLSSHLMGEMAQTADHLLVIGQGRLLADTSLEDFVREHAEPRVRVRAPGRDDELRELLARHGARTTADEPGVAVVTGIGSEVVGALAASRGIALAELTPEQPALEHAFFEMTQHHTTQRAELVGAVRGA
jgi:ABC-2 type transport system ATP-binding protein